MKYQKIVLHTTLESLDDLIEALAQAGIEEIEINDPRDVPELMASKEKTHWDYIDESVLASMLSGPSIIFYVEEGSEVLSALDGLPYVRAEVSVEDDADWLHRWKDYFEPAPISERFAVKPAWSAYEPADGEFVIDLDPGMAFGTGTHETTRLCLRLMEKYLQSGDRVLDVGAGSGILSIAAALLGSSDVLAVDIDGEAVATARENVEKNGVERTVRVQRADLAGGIDFCADVLVSNLMADLIIRFAPDAYRHLAPGGTYIAGGIIDDQKQRVCEALEREGFQVIEALSEGEWWSIAARHRQNG